MLKLNEASWDRVLRLVIAALLLYLGLSGTVAGGVGIAAIVVGVVLVLTAVVGFCPIYAIARTGTRRG